MQDTIFFLCSQCNHRMFSAGNNGIYSKKKEYRGKKRDSSCVYEGYTFALEQAQVLSHLENVPGGGTRLRKDYASESMNPFPNNRVIPLYLPLFSLIPRSYDPSQLMQGTIMPWIPQGIPIGTQQKSILFIQRLGMCFS